jgi:hypothetical protein
LRGVRIEAWRRVSAANAHTPAPATSTGRFFSGEQKLAIVMETGRPA